MTSSNGQNDSVRVLLVEDNADDEFLACWAMQQAGITQITVARDGSEALDMLSGEGTLPDLLVMDLRLPKIDGKEVLRQIRVAPRTRTLPVLILSSSEDIGDKEFCRRYSCLEYVSKPLTTGTMKRVLAMIHTDSSR